MARKGFGLGLRIDGLAETVQQMESLPPKFTRAILRKIMPKAVKPVVAAAKKNALKYKESGLLAKSMGKKTVTYKHAKTWKIVVVIGPRRGFKQKVRRAVFGGSRLVQADPANYAHLVEFGTKPHSITKGSQAPRSQETIDARIARTSRARAGIMKRINERLVEIQNTQHEGKRAAMLAKLEKDKGRLVKVQQRLVERQRAIARTTDFQPQGNGGKFRGIHPGTRPRPFLEQAFTTTQGTVKDIFADECRAELKKIANGGGTKAQRRALAGK